MMDDYVRQAGATLRDAGRSVSKPGNAGMAGPSIAGANGIGSTQQRWMDYDSAKAAEHALRTVLGAPSSAEARSSRPSFSGHHTPLSGYHTPMTHMFGTNQSWPRETGSRTTGTVSPRLWAQISSYTRPGSGLASGAMSPAVIEPLKEGGHVLMHMTSVPENSTRVTAISARTSSTGNQQDGFSNLTLDGVKKLLSTQGTTENRKPQASVSDALDTHDIAREMVLTGVVTPKRRRKRFWKVLRRVTILLVVGGVAGGAAMHLHGADHTSGTKDSEKA